MTRAITGIESDEARDSARGQYWLPTQEAQEAAFVRLRDLALAYDTKELRPLRADIRLACVNAQAGYEAIASHLPEIWELPKVDAAAIERVPTIVAALLFAERQCTRATARDDDAEAWTSADMVNRFWTLLATAHEELERVARFLGLEHAVPSLAS